MTYFNNTRTIRLYDESKPVTKEQISEILESLRFVPQASNSQTVRFITSVDPEMNAKIYAQLKYAGKLPGFSEVMADKRPTGYIILLKEKGKGILMQDAGILEFAIGLTAHELGLGYCIVASVNRAALAKVLDIENRYDILDVVSLGVPAQIATAVDSEDGDTAYYENDAHDHFVKKLSAAARTVKRFE